jgi:hypothetical protein
MLWRVSNRKSHQFCLGLLKIFLIEKKKEQHILCTLQFLFKFMGCFPWRKSCTTSQTYNKHHKIQHTRAQTRAQANVGTLKEKETTFRNDLFWLHLIEVKKSGITMLPWNTHVGNIIRISIINTFESPQGILWDFLWGTVRSTVSRILVLLLMQLSQRKLRSFTGLISRNRSTWG